MPGHFIYPNTIKYTDLWRLERLRTWSSSVQDFQLVFLCQVRLYPPIAVIPTCEFYIYIYIPISKMAGIPLTGKKYTPFPGAKMDAHGIMRLPLSRA